MLGGTRGLRLKSKNVETCVGQEERFTSRGVKNIEHYISLRHENIPFGEQEFWVTGGKAGAKIIFPDLNCAFGRVAMAAVGRDEF